jgi:hypothetical protein
VEAARAALVAETDGNVRAAAFDVTDSARSARPSPAACSRAAGAMLAVL